MSIETRAQTAAEMVDQVNQMMPRLAKLDTRGEEMNQKWTRKWKQEKKKSAQETWK